MADASRFPSLALPFAIVGATAGWLSVGIANHPMPSQAVPTSVRLAAGGIAAGMAGLTGILLRRWCVGKRYDWQVGAPDPDERPRSDSWPRHVMAILAAGTLTGVLLGAAYDALDDAVPLAFLSFLCTLPFLPVCAAVLAAARRAQRARHGSIVAGSDRRAVWTILAIALSLTTLEALPDWLVASDGPLFGPIPALALLVAGTVCILTVSFLDLRALRRARQLLKPGLAHHEAGAPGAEDSAVPRVDLGLGDELRAEHQRGAAAYRARERAIALVQGDPEKAFSALRKAIRRGALGAAVACAVFAAHLAANGQTARLGYQQWLCNHGFAASCGVAAQGRLETGYIEPQDAVALFERGCDRGDAKSCMSLAQLYRRGDGVTRDGAMVAFFEYRAAQRGACPPNTRLVRGAENVCVDPLDSRQ